MFIQTEATPNPETLKFLPGETVLSNGTAEYRDEAAATASPLALRLFQVEGVEGVFLGTDFVSVTKSSTVAWQHIKPALLGAIMEHFMSGEAATDVETGAEHGEDYAPEDEEVVQTIKELLDTRVRPAVANDGGDITFRGFRDGIVFLHMRGACSGCPSSTATLKGGIENLLKHFCPEVQEVQAV